LGSSKADIFSGLPASFSVPPLPSGASISMLRAATCGCSSACLMLLIGPHGMPALPMTASQCAVVLPFRIDSISCSSLP
jgi:hypothetical protein